MNLNSVRARCAEHQHGECKRRVRVHLPVFVQRAAGRHTRYASVLALGADGLQRTLQEMLADIKGSVANTSSYCAKCRRITPSLNAARSIQENAMHWR
jgi:hypothetical protein